MWNMVESQLGMVAANAPALRSLLGQLGGKGKGATTPHPIYSGSGGTLENVFERIPDYNGGCESRVTTLARHGGGSDDNLELLERNRGGLSITVKTDVQQHVQEGLGQSSKSSSRTSCLE